MCAGVTGVLATGVPPGWLAGDAAVLCVMEATLALAGTPVDVTDTGCGVPAAVAALAGVAAARTVEALQAMGFFPGSSCFVAEGVACVAARPIPCSNVCRHCIRPGGTAKAAAGGAAGG